MKIAITISALILVVAMTIGWKIDARLAAAKEDERRLAAEATRLGVALEDGHSPRRTRRVNLEAEAEYLAVEYVRLAKLSENGSKLDEKSQEDYRKCFLRTAALDASGLKTLIADLLANRELDEKKRAEQVVSLLRSVLAKKDPQAALGFVVEHSAALKDFAGLEYVISDSLGTWAKDDPLAAADWMKKNAVEFPDAMSTQSQANVFYATAAKDPRLACSMIKSLDLKFSDAHSALNDIVSVAKTDDERTATLAALREFREANRSDKELVSAVDDNLGYFANGLRKSSFETACKWINDAKLNPKEMEQICGRLSRGIVEDTGKWIEWLGTTLPPGKSDWPIIDMMETWTFQDYEAAGKWLASAPEGPARNAAIRGYAKTVFKHDPETAMQWIMTLPPGPDRDVTLKNIHRNWPKDDPEGAGDFAKEHGIR